MSTNLPPSPPLHTLITAGPSREKIDQVRDWGNIFTGKTGLDLALAFLDLGHVTLLTSNESHARQYDGYYGKAGMIGVETFRSHADLLALLEERMTRMPGGGEGDGGGGADARVDVVAMTAAVADYSPESTWRIVERTPDGTHETWRVEKVGDPSTGKVKSSHDEIAVVGRRTLKLIDQFRSAWNFRGTLIKFKLEVGLTDEQLLQVASASRLASDADLMVANTLAMARPETGGVIGGQSAAYLIDGGRPPRRRVFLRQNLAAEIVAWVRASPRPSLPP